MRCGEQCFIVTIKAEQAEQQIQINARSAIKARKKARSLYGEHIAITSVRLEK